MKRFGNRRFLTGSTNVSFEHVISFATGHGGHIVANLLPMDKALNLSRQDKNFGEWFNTLEATIEMHDAFDEAFEYLAELNGLTVDLFGNTSTIATHIAARKKKSKPTHVQALKYSRNGKKRGRDMNGNNIITIVCYGVLMRNAVFIVYKKPP